MKYIILGIKDYCKDCWHDWLLKRLYNYYKGKKQLSYFEPKLDMYVCVNPWKEGSVWHYIKQRKIAKGKKHE